jgi:hypothetical protein
MQSDVTSEPSLSGGRSILEIAYTLTLDDHVALYLHVWEKNARDHWIVRWLVLVVAIVALLSVATAIEVTVVAAQNRSVRKEAFFVVAAGIIAAFACHLLWMLTWRGLGPKGFFRDMARAAYQKKLRQGVKELIESGAKRIGRRDRVVLMEEGFVETTDYSEGDGGACIREHKEYHVSWSAVESIDVTADHVFFTVTGKGYLIVPRYSFSQTADFDHFASTARDCHRAFLTRGFGQRRLVEVDERTTPGAQETRGRPT